MNAVRILAGLTLFASQAGAQTTTACANQPTCIELRKLTVRFRNTSAKPLILGYLRDSGIGPGGGRR